MKKEIDFEMVQQEKEKSKIQTQKSKPRRM